MGVKDLLTSKDLSIRRGRKCCHFYSSRLWLNKDS